MSVKKTNGKLEFYPSVGGLATALSGYTTDKSSKWIGWPGIAADEVTEAEQRQISRELRTYNCYPVFLTQKQLDAYYNGFCNSILWQLFHNLPTKMEHYDANWKAYREMNAIYTDAVLALGAKNSTVWVHDYQLLLVPSLLRADRPHDTIGLFLHIPFPDFKTFRTLPHAKQILVGMLGADLVGFHTVSYTNNFLDCCAELHVGVTSDKNLLIEDRVVRVTDFPISIDYAKSIKLSNSTAVAREAVAHRKKYGRKKVILTVDRLDPTKGLVQRLEAYEMFLAQNPQMHTKVVMVMLATPSRTEIEEYKALKTHVEQLVTSINETYGVAGWLPVDYKYETLPYERVVALYKIADVAFITPIRDGMNLVAKEYIAAKQNSDGVLILSETAGAAEELTNAIIVNPNKRSAMAEALNSALTMPKLELKSRLSAMQEQISVNTVQKWTKNFMGTLQHSNQLKTYRTRHLVGQMSQLLVDNYRQASNRLLLLNYDGTLSNFVDDPADAGPTTALHNLLAKLAAFPGNDVIVVSGRSKTDLEKWLGDLPITLAAEHGAYMKSPGKKWHHRGARTLGWKKSICTIMEIYAVRTPGAFVEEKDSSLVWHYRKSPPYHAQKNMVILKQLLTQSLKGTDLKVHSGHKVLEVKSVSANKGIAASEFIKNNHDFIMAMGDDYTDEDMFSSLPSHAFTVKVGPGRTHARYRIDSVEEVHKLLKRLT